MTVRAPNPHDPAALLRAGLSALMKRPEPSARLVDAVGRELVAQYRLPESVVEVRDALTGQVVARSMQGHPLEIDTRTMARALRDRTPSRRPAR